MQHQGKMVVIAKFSGGWKEGRCEHRGGVFQGELHSRNFKGKWEPGMPHGEGTMEYVVFCGCFEKDKRYFRKYRGYFHNGDLHGFGILDYACIEGKGTYEDEWLNGKEHGNGKDEEPNGSVYEGMWKDGKEHGNVKYRITHRRKYRIGYRIECGIQYIIEYRTETRIEHIIQHRTGYKLEYRILCRIENKIKIQIRIKNRI